MPPQHVEDLYDYLSWFEQQLYYLAAILTTEDDHLDVQVLGEPTCLLIINKQRLKFHNGCYLQFDLRVNDSFEQREYSYHFARADDSLIWRLDKHPVAAQCPAVVHIHRPPAEHDHIPHAEVEVDEVVQMIYDSGELESSSD